MTEADYNKKTKAELVALLIERDASPDEKDTTIEGLNKTIKLQQEEMERMSEEVTATEQTAGRKNFGVFKLDGKTYEITAPKFSYNGKPYAAEQLVKNKELQAEFVKINAGIIKLLEV